MVGSKKADPATPGYDSQHEALAHERADLFGWKIDDGNDLFADEIAFCISVCDLGTAHACAQRTKVDFKLVGWFSCLWKIIGFEDGACSYIDLLEVRPADKRFLHAVKIEQRKKIAQHAL